MMVTLAYGQQTVLILTSNGFGGAADTIQQVSSGAARTSERRRTALTHADLFPTRSY